MMNHSPNHKPAVFAAMAASLLMLIGGLAYRVMATPRNKTPIDPAALQGFPMQIGNWVGQDVALDDAIVLRTNADAHINRQYSRSNSLESISLYVACGRAPRLLSHRPEICYTGAGWALAHRYSIELPLNSGAKLPCSVFQFVRGGLDVKRVTVLHYFIVDGQCGDDSLLRRKGWGRFAKTGYVAQVQVVTQAETFTDDSAIKRVCAFAVDSAAPIARLFEDIKKDWNSGESRSVPEGK